MSDKENKAAIRAQETEKKKQEKAAKKAAKREERQEKYDQLRANVPRRRTAYVLFIITAIVLVAVAVLDILFLDEALYYAVIVIFVVFVIWAFLLLFSRKTGEERVRKATPDQDFLRCPTCRHVFGFEMSHESRSSVIFTCPECGTPGRLPGTEEELHPAPVPGGGRQGPRFKCGECGERWSVGALGHDPKSDVYFQACPHCGSGADLQRVIDEPSSEEMGSREFTMAHDDGSYPS